MHVLLREYDSLLGNGVAARILPRTFSASESLIMLS